MRLYKKEGNTVLVLSFPGEEAEKGDYLQIEDTKSNRSLIAQVIDVQFANIPGILEELLRDTSGYEHVHGEDLDPLDVGSQVTYIQDAKLLLCKIRGTMQDGKLSVDNSWLPSRSQSSIRKLPTESLMKIVRIGEELSIDLGQTRELTQLTIDARDLDGKLNIVTGKKETGKSHLSKILVLGLINLGAPIVVLDLNGEYASLGLSSKNEKTEDYNKICVLNPGANFRVTLAQTYLRVIMNILVHALGLPGTSTREFRRIWQYLNEHGIPTLQALGETIQNWKCNQFVRDALFSRYYSLLNSGFFTDSIAEATTLEDNFSKIREGGALVVNLKDVSTVDRQIVVEFMLGKLVELLLQNKIRAVFLFAEEAHLYLRETYWEDIVTRMRHFGIFTTFVTNQPDTIRENIYRQADNIFLFNFTNESDLETVSRASRVDGETVKLIARDLPSHHCLILGKIVRDFPIVAKVRALAIQTKGQTRFFFEKTARRF